MKKILTIAAVLALVSSSAQAWESLIARHYGANNPTNENWNLNEWSGAVTTSANATDPSWVIADYWTGGGLNYNFFLDDTTKTNMNDNGWKLTVDAYAQTNLNSAIMASVPSPQGVYQLKLGKIAGQQVIQLWTSVSNSMSLYGAVTNAVDGFHVTELIYDGNASGEVDMYVDGVLKFDNVTSDGAGSYPFFGSGSSADIGEGRYKEVTLEIYLGSTIVSHVGDNDPATEGWNENGFGGVVALWGHGTDPAWVVSDNNSGGGANYNFFMDDATQTNMSNYGWKLTVDAYAPWTRLNSAAMISIPTQQGVYQLKLGKVAGEQVIQLWTVSGSLSLYGAVTNAVNYYHTTELVYDGNASGGVDMFVDGVLVFSNVASAGGGHYPFFGSGSSSDIGEGRFREVELRTLSGENTILSGDFSIGYGVTTSTDGGWTTNEYGTAWDSDVGADFELKHEFVEVGGGFSNNGPTFENGILGSGVPGDYSRMMSATVPLSFQVTGQYIGSALPAGATNVTTTLVIDNVSIYGYRNHATGGGDVSTWWSEGSVTSPVTTIITNYYGWGNANLWEPIKWNPGETAVAGSDQVERTFAMNAGDVELVCMEGFEVSGHIELHYDFLTSGGTPYWWLEQQNPAWTNDYEALAATDHDGDGAPTGDEYFAGTDPNDSNSAFVVEMDGDVISFETLEAAAPPPGRLAQERRYSMEESTDLTIGWLEVPGYTNILGEGQTVIYTNTPSGTTEFFHGRTWFE